MPPEHPLAGAAVALGRALREAGLAVSVDEEMVLCRALGELDLRRRSHVYWAARAAFVRGPGEVPAFDAVFKRFWAGQGLGAGEPMVQHGETDPRMPGPQHGGISLPQFRQAGLNMTLLDGTARRAASELPSAGSEEPGDRNSRRRHGLLAAYSPEEVEAPDARLEYRRDELEAVPRPGPGPRGGPSPRRPPPPPVG